MSRETEPEKISQKLQQLCQTAIVFNDELKKKPSPKILESMD